MTACVVTIGGSDPYAGGGIQTDMKTIEAHGGFALSVLTSIVTNTQSGFTIHPVADEIFEAQLASLEQVELHAIKIGLIQSERQVDLLVRFLRARPSVPVVLDPVFALKETTKEQSHHVVKQLVTKLAPYTTICTPNLVEGATLAGNTLPETLTQMEQMTHQLVALYDSSFCVKGGERLPTKKACDYLVTKTEETWFEQPKIIQGAVNGAGCAFAAAIAVHLAYQQPLSVSVKEAKAFVYRAIQSGIHVTPEHASVWRQVKEESS